MSNRDKQRRLGRATDHIARARDGGGPKWTPELAFMASMREQLGLMVDPSAGFDGGPDDARRMAWRAAASALGVSVDELDSMAGRGDPDRVGGLADHAARLRTELDEAFDVPEIPRATHSSGRAWDVFDAAAGALGAALRQELEMRKQQREQGE